MRRLFALALLVLLAGCVNIPDEQLKPPQILEQQQITEVPVAAPVALPAAPAPNVTAPKNATPNALAPLPKVSQVTHATVPQNTSPPPAQNGWTTEPLQIEEGQTMRIVLQKTK